MADAPAPDEVHAPKTTVDRSAYAGALQGWFERRHPEFRRGRGQWRGDPHGHGFLQRDGVLPAGLEGRRRLPRAPLRGPHRARYGSAVPPTDPRAHRLGRAPVPHHGGCRSPRRARAADGRLRTRRRGARSALLRDGVRRGGHTRRHPEVQRSRVPHRGGHTSRTSPDGEDRVGSHGPDPRHRLAGSRVAVARQQRRAPQPGPPARPLPPLGGSPLRRSTAPGDGPSARLARRQRPPRRADRTELGGLPPRQRDLERLRAGGGVRLGGLRPLPHRGGTSAGGSCSTACRSRTSVPTAWRGSRPAKR